MVGFTLASHNTSDRMVSIKPCLINHNTFFTTMTIEELTQLVVNALEDVKAKDIKVFNTEELTDQFERVVICSGTSNRQTRALAYSVSSEVKQAGGDVLGMEGQDTG